jgi:L-ascorbate metabolism protein UlaG (beta-lactamase superfamily)
MTRILHIFLLFALCLAISFSQTNLAHHTEGGFRNPDPKFEDTGFLKLTTWRFRLLGQAFDKSQIDIPRLYNDGNILRSQKPYSVTWIGQSTVLLQIEGKNILTDPVWSTRIGPIRWTGAPRISEPGISLERLPPIDIVLISHNQYDHLDEATILKLAENRNTRFFVPLRLRDWFEDLGISNIMELDWWEGVTFKDLKIVCTPAQFFSGRFLTDKNKTLWSSWVILSKSRKLFYCGDTGLFDGLAEIGKKFGPFDLSILPIGGYLPQDLMKSISLTPENALKASALLRSKKMLAIHWGTFKLTDEPIEEPPRRLREAAGRQELPLENYWIFMIGETREW